MLVVDPRGQKFPTVHDVHTRPSPNAPASHTQVVELNLTVGAMQVQSDSNVEATGETKLPGHTRQVVPPDILALLHTQLSMFGEPSGETEFAGQALHCVLLT